MTTKNLGTVIIGLVLIFFVTAVATAADRERYNVLVVMSYAPDYQFVQEIQEGIESVLSHNSRIEYVYLDTRNNFAGGPQKAKMAYELYLKLAPDGVIVADDNAQSMFTLPYLKGRVETPVIFCGVNSDPEKYGYPAANVTGVLERHHVSQTLALAKQLLPTIRTFSVMGSDSLSARSSVEHFHKEEHTFPAKFVGASFPGTLAEAKKMARQMRSTSDVLYMPTIRGVRDDAGNALVEKEVVAAVAQAYGKPIISGNNYSIPYGMLCGVVKTGQEQGSLAAEMLLKAMQGTPLSELPVTRNRKGKSVINVTVMKAFGIKPKPIVLRGTELVRTEP
ncbi:MAG: ABC transporter substrate-binding protein [Gammaproteobacteria bacterium]|nr:ABC transporter substrate-binding protein [Gammaproteobacteria bacterium]